MDYGDYYRDYYRDPFPHSLLSTRQRQGSSSERFRKGRGSGWGGRRGFGAEEVSRIVPSYNHRFRV